MSPKRIDKLTKAQEARFEEWGDKWIEIGLRTGAADLDAFTEGAKRCYEAAGIEWPGVVVRVPSPLVMSLAAPVAALVLELRDDDAVRGAVDVAVRDAVRGAVDGAVGVAVRDAVDGAVGDAVRGAVRGAVDGAVRGAVDGAVGVAVDDAVRDAVRGAVRGAVGDAVRDAVRGAVDVAVRDAVDGAVGDAVGDAVDGAVGDAVRGAVRGAVDGAVGVAVDDAVRDAVRGAVRGAVGVAVDDAVRVAQNPQRDRVIHKAVFDVIEKSRGRYVGGWWTYWQAWTTYFRDVCDLELKDGMWDRSRAYQACTESAGWWWPTKRFVMVCDRPTQIHREQVGVRGWGSHRLHNESGPSISWSDGWALYHVHGVRVTEQIIMRPETITVEQVFKEDNAEVRRVMIERMPGGWLGFAESANLTLLDECPDPANKPNMLRLYELPPEIRDVLGTPVRLLTCRNATPERDGTVRDFGLTIPVDMTRAIDAAAWTFGTDAKTYKQLVRAT